MSLRKWIDSISNRVGRIETNLGRSFRFDLIKQNFLFIIIILYFAVYLGGIINAIESAPSLPAGTIFVPDRSYETGMEFIIALMNFVIGFGGVYLIYRGANSINQRDSRNNFVAGTILLILATIIMILFLYSKGML
ncbi:MAG: hypothetical protein ABSB40_07455 [Nitrososphaeria archaeon]|jgi:hypothetical protein